MEQKPKANILALVRDLFFAAKIRETAGRVGVGVEFASSGEALVESAACQPSLIIIDLSPSAPDPLSLIARLKGRPGLEHTTILGFVSHVQSEIKKQAQGAGCDLVLARSAFSDDLPQILQRYR